MSDDDDMTQINVEVPESTKELAKEELGHGGLSRVIRQRLTEIAHGEQVGKRERIADQLEELRDEKREKVSARNKLDNQIADLDIKIERKERTMQDLEDSVGQYEGYLQSIEDQMHEHEMSVFVGHGQVETAAKLGDCTETDVLDDLRERNPDLPDEQFEENETIV
jgi:chromosome segregation ATPase